MLTLRYSPVSPFARKVRVSALFTGHAKAMVLVSADTLNPDDPLRHDNPLGKIPCLVLADGMTLYDSRVIVEYLDHDAGGDVIIPQAWPARLHVLKMQALVDGVADAAILKVYENRFRKPEMHDAGWLAHQTGKLERGMAALEAAPPVIDPIPHIGAISLASMLEWLDLRLSVLTNGDYPQLKAFLREFHAKVPEFAASKPQV